MRRPAILVLVVRTIHGRGLRVLYESRKLASADGANPITGTFPPPVDIFTNQTTT